MKLKCERFSLNCVKNVNTFLLWIFYKTYVCYASKLQSRQTGYDQKKRQVVPFFVKRKVKHSPTHSIVFNYFR